MLIWIRLVQCERWHVLSGILVSAKLACRLLYQTQSCQSTLLLEISQVVLYGPGYDDCIITIALVSD